MCMLKEVSSPDSEHAKLPIKTLQLLLKYPKNKQKEKKNFVWSTGSVCKIRKQQLPSVQQIGYPKAKYQILNSQ